jgi:glycosyltransferase involved in cell wall biosynthesis
MRVAIFAESYLPYRSGVTVSTDALAAGLAAAGHDVLLVAPRPAAVWPAVPAGVQVAWLPSYQLPALVPPDYRMPLPLAWRAAMREVLDFAPDVLHAQSPFASGLLALRLARRLDAPLIFTHHTRFADYRHYLGPLARPGVLLIGAYLRTFWSRCAAVIAPSHDMACDIEERLAPDRVRPILRVIPTGLDLMMIRTLDAVDPRPLVGWPDDALVVASLGRLAPEKSVAELVDAVLAARRREPRLRLLLVGGGPLEAALRRRWDDAPDAPVHVTGGMPRLDALALLKGADLFAFASRTETQGLVLAEALTCGLPVVARAGPAVGESVRDGVDGAIVASPAAFADALLGLAGDPKRREAMAARALAGSDRFDQSRRVAEMLELYRDALTR